uniref:PH domain-containing protein n=1 Tax=Odontella aurita TaxID=265563 RepID=A0A7S4IAT0_9STRA|mmetsp:Transcript_22308/g.66109  ORF Transcript_22308/g.66109 Transcript_22308/m.66109 type:complete len:808 (+) Transcript_22308:417-2840(+)
MSDDAAEIPPGNAAAGEVVGVPPADDLPEESESSPVAAAVDEAPPPALMDEAEAAPPVQEAEIGEGEAAVPAPAGAPDADDDDEFGDFGDFEGAGEQADVEDAPVPAESDPPQEDPPADAAAAPGVVPSPAAEEEHPAEAVAETAAAEEVSAPAHPVAPEEAEEAPVEDGAPPTTVEESSPGEEEMPTLPAEEGEDEAPAAAEEEAAKEADDEPPKDLPLPAPETPPPAPAAPAAEHSVSAQAKAGMATPRPVENSVRATSHSRLRAYEAKRRSAYTSKLGSSSLYWRSFRDLLHSSLEETERAEVLVLGNAMANRAYSVAMACAAEDALDDDGRPVLDPKKRKKLKERREKIRADRRGYGKGAADGTGGGAATLQGETEEGRRRGSALRSPTPSQDASLEKRGTMLHSLVESHGILAERFAENAKFVHEEMAMEIGNLRDDLNGEVETMEKLGDAILDELEEAEHEVDRAWEKYYTVATRALGHSTRSEGRKGAISATDPSAAEKEPLSDCLDVWVVEMQYRMSVAYLSACWEKCSSELSKLFASMKETECTRRFRLRELLITFVQRQERLWLGLPSVLTPVLKDLVDRPMDRTSIENDVQQSIRLRAQSIQREEQADKQHREKEARDRTGPGLTGVNASEGNFELSSPLLSDLLFKAHVIEKKGSGYMSAWKTTLAVVTADSFLHLFELPPAVRVQSGSASEVAFHALVPPVEVPTQESVAHGHARRKAASEWYEHLVPAESLVLPNCSLAYKDEPGNSTFEVKETVFNVGASKMFGSTTTRKLYLRTLSREETLKWIKALKAPK